MYLERGVHLERKLPRAQMARDTNAVMRILDVVAEIGHAWLGLPAFVAVDLGPVEAFDVVVEFVLEHGHGAGGEAAEAAVVATVLHAENGNKQIIIELQMKYKLFPFSKYKTKISKLKAKINVEFN